MTVLTMQNASKKISTSKKIANYLLNIGAVKFNVDFGFRWTSGIRSPIYCDNRIINSKVEVRDAVVNAFTDIIRDMKLNSNDIIGGIATGGMTYGVLAADRLQMPFIYVREKKKEHGLKKAVEGDFKEGDRVVLIEDHISTGGSSLNAIKLLRDEKLELISLLSITTYGLDESEQAFKTENAIHESICNLDTILEVALEKNIINPLDIDTILSFKKSYKKWVPKFF